MLRRPLPKHDLASQVAEPPSREPGQRSRGLGAEPGTRPSPAPAGGLHLHSPIKLRFMIEILHDSKY